MPTKITELSIYNSPTSAVAHNTAVVKKFCEDFHTTIHHVGSSLGYLIEGALSVAYTFGDVPYKKRLNQWAKIVGIPPRKLLTINLMYEFAQCGAFNPFGCTSVVFRTTRDGVVHVRNMDWELKDMGRTTVIIDTDKYVSVSNPGMLGALSGMVAGEFSITLNWAPPCTFPRFNRGPLFLVQEILEKASTYEEAVEMAEKTPISVPALFHIAGAVDTCVVERLPLHYNTRKMRGRQPLVLTNHFMADSMRKYNRYQDREVNGCSRRRYKDALQMARATWTATKKRSYHHVLSTDETLHDGTVQQMVFYPQEGHYSVIAFDNNDVLEC